MAIITQLPNELLAQIIEYALTTSDYRREIQQKQEFKLGRGKGDTLSIYRNGHLRDLGRVRSVVRDLNQSFGARSRLLALLLADFAIPLRGAAR